MEKLFMMDFPTEQIKLNVCYHNKEILEAIQSESPDRTIKKVSEVYGELLFPLAPDDRPYTFCSVVLSADGKMSYSNNQHGSLIGKENYLDPDGSLADWWFLNALRAYADGVIIGARTLQCEKFATSHVFDREMAVQRIEGMGKPAHPLNVVISFDATDIPFDHLIFNIDPEETFPVIVATSPQGGEYIAGNLKKDHVIFGPYLDKGEIDEQQVGLINDALQDQSAIPVILTGQENHPDSRVLLYLLRKLGLERLLMESPSYNWHLMEEEMLDEFFINYSMVYAGGGITPGYNRGFTYDNHPHAKILTVGTHNSNFIFTRQKIFYGISSQEDLSKYKY
jgi:riboflavin biosynthesis pyrimidine reductase